MLWWLSFDKIIAYILEIIPPLWRFNLNASSQGDFVGREGNPENREEAQCLIWKYRNRWEEGKLNYNDNSEKLANTLLMKRSSKHFRPFFSQRENTESEKGGRKRWFLCIGAMVDAEVNLKWRRNWKNILREEHTIGLSV